MQMGTHTHTHIHIHIHMHIHIHAYTRTHAHSTCAAHNKSTKRLLSPRRRRNECPCACAAHWVVGWVVKQAREREQRTKEKQGHGTLKAFFLLSSLVCSLSTALMPLFQCLAHFGDSASPASVWICVLQQTMQQQKQTKKGNPLQAWKQQTHTPFHRQSSSSSLHPFMTHWMSGLRLASPRNDGEKMPDRWNDGENGLSAPLADVKL